MTVVVSDKVDIETRVKQALQPYKPCTSATTNMSDTAAFIVPLPMFMTVDIAICSRYLAGARFQCYQ